MGDGTGGANYAPFRAKSFVCFIRADCTGRAALRRATPRHAAGTPSTTSHRTHTADGLRWGLGLGQVRGEAGRGGRTIEWPRNDLQVLIMSVVRNDFEVEAGAPTPIEIADDAVIIQANPSRIKEQSSHPRPACKRAAVVFGRRIPRCKVQCIYSLPRGHSEKCVHKCLNIRNVLSIFMKMSCFYFFGRVRVTV